MSPRQYDGAAMILRDFRLAVRMLVRQRTVTAVAILTLALGVGLNTAIFSVLESIVLRQLPYPAADRLVAISREDGSGRPTLDTDVWTMQQWLDRGHTVESIALYGDAQFRFLDRGNAEVWRGMRVTAAFFDTLGVKPLIGRTFAPDEDHAPIRARVLVLGYDLWRRRFNEDPAIVGRVLDIAGRPARVIGVLPSDFHPIHMSNPAEVPQLFTQAEFDPREVEECHTCSRSGRIIARLAPAVSATSASAELTAISRDLARKFPSDPSRYATVLAEPLLDRLVGPVRRALWILFGAVTFVLLIACANVAGIQLARSRARSREFAVRSALGGSRAALIRQLLIENVVLAAVGGAAGTAVVPAITAFLVSRAPAALPRLDDVYVDGRALAFALLATLATGVLFGLLPALSASRTDVNEALRRGSGGGARASSAPLGTAVVTVGAALAFALAVVTGLLGRTVVRLESLDAGFDAHQVLTLTPDGSYETAELRLTYLRTLIDRISVIPGVESAGTISNVPLSRIESFPVRIDGTATAAGAMPMADLFWASAGYFRVLRIPLKRGHLFDDRESPSASMHSAVVSETFARAYFRDRNPIGHTIEIGPGESMLRIVGVVGDVRYARLDRSAGTAVYVPQSVTPFHYTRLAIRTSRDPLQLASAVLAAIRQIDPAQPAFHVQPMDDYVLASLASRRFAFALIALFGIVALTLAAVGVYGLVSYSVVQRTRELGIRASLGATGGQIVRLLVWDGLCGVLAGIGVGVAVAIVSGRLLASLLFGVHPTDAATLVVSALVLIAAALGASYLPARAALKLEPLVALRAD
jgi:putative ABC transport system permease protein